ncbi:NADP-dependent oxidoreductase [Williamsia sterculiae]|uniref:NADPH:quinone reductase n=1 Tax=Williamsia sterculiae TaxID=1344003 RepID=A0A1N7GA95_9NOCA|nr:NADP-dependent oxidoreductase [Williamsia sterculiae]SIS09513.1 NADPH:quinone reductase [Williamsia sterculiae]
MRAVQFHRFGTPDVLEVVDLPDPHPGPGEVRIAVRAAGINASDWKKRRGEMDEGLPQTLGYEAAGVVDELGAGVTDAAIGDRVFGFSAGGCAQAELAVLSEYAHIPPSLGFAEAATVPTSAETAARALDQLGVGDGATVLITGASGNIGGAAVQLAVARGARVIGAGSPATHDQLRAMGSEPVTYGDGMIDRARALAPDGVDLALDIAGNGVLPGLIELTGSPDKVVTVADFAGAAATGVRFSRGDTGRALYALGAVADLVAAKRYVLPAVHSFPLSHIADAHRAGESGSLRGKLVVAPD